MFHFHEGGTYRWKFRKQQVSNKTNVAYVIKHFKDFCTGLMNGANYSATSSSQGTQQWNALITRSTVQTAVDEHGGRCNETINQNPWDWACFVATGCCKDDCSRDDDNDSNDDWNTAWISHSRINAYAGFRIIKNNKCTNQDLLSFYRFACSDMDLHATPDDALKKLEMNKRLLHGNILDLQANLSIVLWNSLIPS